MQRLFTYLLALIIAAGPLNPAMAKHKAVSDGTPLATLDTHGGSCEEKPCHTVTNIYENGTCEGPDCKRPNFTPEEIAHLKEAINGTDFDAIKETEFVGDCPTSPDVPKFAYVFRTDKGKVKLGTCEYAIDSYREPFHSLWKMLDKK
jgi:hypothetical protein